MGTEQTEISGKVFRFLSAMHPALSRAERKRYAGFDPDKWYPWTVEVSAEYTELMRRSPRDTSFARGFAYVAQKAVPEGQYIPTKDLLEHLARLPAAFRSPKGSGFRSHIDAPGRATVSYSGMPGFANVCIAIQGELQQRLQAAGAQSVVVKHSPACRLSGAEECEFEIEWAGETAPAGAQPADLKRILGPQAEAAAGPQVEQAESVATAAGRSGNGSLQPAGQRASVAAKASYQPASGNSARTAAAVSAASPAAGAGLEDIEAGVSSDDLFQQLRKRLAAADRQAELYRAAQQEIDGLRLELGRVRAQAEADLAEAQREREESSSALKELKRRIRALVADD